MLEQIKETLRGGGLTVYDSTEEIGECRAPCLVAYDHGIEAQTGTKGLLGRHTYEVACLAPSTGTADLPALESQARQLLRQLPGMRFASSSGAEAEQTLQARKLVMTYTTCERL